MAQKQQIWWEILEKYDAQVEMQAFCNSLSRAIQGLDLSDLDILNIAAISPSVEPQEMELIDQTIGICHVIF